MKDKPHQGKLVYKVTIRGDKYPTDYYVNGSSWQGAVAAAIREWRKRFKGSRTSELHIRATKGDKIIEQPNGE